MTNLVFIEHRKVPKAQVRAIKQDLQVYAISVAAKLAADIIPEEQRIRVAKFSVRSLLKKFDLSTKNLSSLLYGEVLYNLHDLYVKLRKRTLNEELIEMIAEIKRLRKRHPRKYKKLRNSLEKKLNNKQTAVFNIYLGFQPKGRRRQLTYKTVSKLSRIPAGTINPQMKHIVRSLNKLLKIKR